jgi:hypothetical protein
VKLRGERFSFRAGGNEYSGRVEGASIRGEGWSAQRAK